MAKTTSMILGPKYDAMIAEEVATGDYATASEVMREALRRFRRARLREAYDRKIVDARAGGPWSPRTHEEIAGAARARMAARAAEKGSQ